jgi:acetoin utilization protein AcuB
MRLGDIMSENVDSISPGDPLQLAMELMGRQQIHHLVVIDGRDVVGVISAGDLDPRRSSAGVVARDVMSHPVVTALPDTTVTEAANLLRGRHIGCLPIVENGRLVGIVTVADLLDVLGRS